ncbi:Inner spore coat protein H [Rubripirellula tenax]|uniref:Inner spore coat protein H n=1 Tax=Rubripirellula tenax TaxID=2528015 RepID=A0A5C6E4K1_9BACT|nr:DUF4347 domain-containing protein [Rubripirellula tenax]TWU43605.1 Inner spore coat protein H [Rubripirellula tenax]
MNRVPFARSNREKSTSSNRKRRSLRWDLTQLEQRIMLAGDCGVAMSQVSECATVQVAPPSVVAAAQASHLVFIDASVDNIEQLAGGVADNHELVLLDANRSGIEQISEVLATRRGVASLHILAHGESGQIQLGNELVDRSTLDRMSNLIVGWTRALTVDADILIYGCETAAGSRGQQFIQRIAELTGGDVAASTNTTGSRLRGADWDLEQHVGAIESSLAFHSTTLNAYQSTLPITIRAAGARGEETMLLQIDGATVATYNNVGGNIAAREYQSFTYNANGIDADRIRVAFTNDLYDPANGIDRNLRVDNITVDGVTYETEAPEVYSTGTWLAADGIVPGFRQKETLHGNGYFQYAGQGEPVDPIDPVDPPDGAFAIINEIHYNPGPDGVVDPDAEFLELYNPGTADYDLSGASFAGFDLVFASGTTLAAGQYAIVAPSASIAQSQWGVTPIAEFAAGGLSGGGETIQLIAADGVTIIDEVSYDDASPWPGGPDGNGPSLELINPTFDNSLAASWGTSTTSPTPGGQNSIYAESAPSDVTGITITPGVPVANQAFTVSATIADAAFATLTYKVMFGADQTVSMTNIGGDVWQAVVPGQEAGTLVRYRIDSDVATAPFEGDTINYLGVVVSPNVPGNTLPLFQFFVDEAEFQELTTTDLRLTNTTIGAVVAYNGEVFENATIRVRGGDHARANFPKQSMKFELPSGYAIDIGPEGSYPIDEFGINADFGDWTVLTPELSWDVFNAETDSFVSSFFTRVHMNGDFHGLFRFQELYDGAYRKATGIDDNELFKAEEGGFGSTAKFDKKNPDDGDYSSINAINQVLTSPPSASKTAWLYENVDVAETVNHMALSALMRHDDQRVQNFYMALDPETNVWSIIEWDVDRTWRLTDDETPGTFTTPEPIRHELLDSMWEVPEFRDMYWRRIQTLVDKYLGNDQLIQRRAEVIEQIGALNGADEFAKWGRSNISTNQFWVDDWQNSIDIRRADFAAETRMPGTASGTANVVINELHYNPLDGQAEFIELYNNSNESIDLSGWTIDGIDLTIGYGTVLLADQYVVFTDNAIQFKSQYGGNIFVGSQYSGGLSGGGETITLLDVNGSVVDQVAYDDAAPWATEPDGGGSSLALVNPNSDNNVATNWVASEQLGGTPGFANDPGSAGGTTTIRIFAAGQTTNEIIQLQIGGAIVATYNIGLSGGSLGDYSSRNFIELSYESPQPVAASDVRINFVNDTYDPANGIDYNVKIDRIEIGALSYETEAASTFSTGTWLPGVGIQPGFLLSEVLHTNGYFQFLA